MLWINRLPEDCTLIFLGDFCIGNDAEWHRELFLGRKFKKILVRGNHDRKSASFYTSHGWDFVCDSFSLAIYGRKILFSHTPQPIVGHNCNIHGHCHNHLRDGEYGGIYTPFHKLLAMESTNYQVVELRGFVEKAGLKKVKEPLTKS